jgi:hypothetical protein
MEQTLNHMLALGPNIPFEINNHQTTLVHPQTKQVDNGLMNPKITHPSIIPRALALGLH